MLENTFTIYPENISVTKDIIVYYVQDFLEPSQGPLDVQLLSTLLIHSYSLSVNFLANYLLGVGRLFIPIDL